MEKIYQVIEDLLKVSESSAKWIFICAIVIVVLLIVLVVLLISKKKQSKKKAQKETNYYVGANLQAEEKPVKQQTEEKEVKAEVVANSVEETKVVEEVKEAKVEEPQEEKTTEPAKEEVVEEKPAKQQAAEEAKAEVVESVKEETTKPVEEKQLKKQRTPKPKAVEETTPKATPVEEKTPVKEKVEKVVEEEKEDVKTGRIMLGKYEIFHVNDMYLYRLKASNGEIMVISEIYKSEKGAITAVENVKKNIETGTLQIYKDKHNLWQFKLFASNKRLLVVSANYSTQQGCESAANSFKKFATISPVVVLEDDPEHLMEEITLTYDSDKKGGKLLINALEDVFEFKLCASNGVVLCSSSEYASKAAVFNGISTFKAAVQQGRFVVVKDKNAMYQFKLYSPAGRCVVIGEAYKNKVQAISAANSVASFVVMAEIIDKTNEKVSV